MDSTVIIGVVAVLVSVLTLVWAIIKYVIDKHSQTVYETIAQNKIEAKERFKALEDSQKSNEKLIIETRDELHTHYVRNEQLDKDITEVKDILGKLFEQMSAISRDLNRWIGKHKTS